MRPRPDGQRFQAQRAIQASGVPALCAEPEPTVGTLSPGAAVSPLAAVSCRCSLARKHYLSFFLNLIQVSKNSHKF